MELEGSLPHSRVPTTCPVWTFCNKVCLYSEELLAPRPTRKLEDHPVSAVQYCLFNIFAATLHIGGRSSIHNPRTRHAVVTGTHLSWGDYHILAEMFQESGRAAHSGLHKFIHFICSKEELPQQWMVSISVNGQALEQQMYLAEILQRSFHTFHSHTCNFLHVLITVQISVNILTHQLFSSIRCTHHMKKRKMKPHTLSILKPVLPPHPYSLCS
jgi:hypothetical protein